MKNKKIIVIGGGAAGIFAAANAANFNPGAEVLVLEKSNKLLAKVKISGGGRCNVTHACFKNSQLIKFYPRGGKGLRAVLDQFTASDTIAWFESRGVRLKIEADGRIFPVTDDSQTVIDCLIDECTKAGVVIKKSCGVRALEKNGKHFLISCLNDENFLADNVIIATGGNPKPEAYSWLREMAGHHIENPVPSLFTFNVPDSQLKDLAGVSMPEANIKVTGTKLEYKGPLLITHWGFSGPAVLKLSAWGARYLNELNYNFSIQIRWIAAHKEEQVRKDLNHYKEAHPKKLIAINPLFQIPQRLWQRLVNFAGISPDLKWLDLPKKNLNKLVEVLVRAEFQVKGKTTFKEEFVTCGGVSVGDIEFTTMESKMCKGLFMAGEVLDIDGITGGFNFQSAWATAYVAAKNV